MSQATLGSGPYRNSNLFSGYYLDERVDDLDDWESDDEAEAVFEDLRELWELEGDLVSSYGEDELLDQWISKVLGSLGFDTISEGTLPDGGGYVDRLLYESSEARRGAAERKLQHDQEGMFSRASALLEAKQWGHDFEKRFSEERSYRDASHQVKYYLERTPGDLQWGILTDGRKWRLYGTKDYETQTYYEVDLPELLESGDLQQFKYFYCFFRPEAFVEVAGTSFLETVWSESETAAQELGEDLQDNVFTALRVLGKGFVESNDLNIDPEDETEREELKEQSLVLLYRLMFVLYAESRGLIDPEAPSANVEYHENFSLEEVRGDIIDAVEGGDVESGAAFHEEYSEFSTTIWNRLSRLFELIDEGEEALDIPPYNGGLFDHDDHEFLAENEVSDPAIAEVIFRLSTTQNEAGEYVPADYADLDTRHLGSIYEGLLEHEFRIAPEEGMAAVAEDGGQVWKPASEVSVADAVETVESGGLYVVNDEGERKATGAYYTPDYVVTYIVEETVDPLVDEIHADLEADGLSRSDGEYFRRFYDRVTDLTILDPAMGSGHFLTKATGYLTEQVMEVVREQEIQSYDEQDIRREISKEAIYGVDLNGMAVELAKLSMWLETLAADQPLAFLDHHLKAGNSLVGSDITEVLSEDGPDGDDGQITLTQAFARVRQDTLEHVMELMADLLAYDNETLEDVKSMEELYDEIREDPLYTRLFELANVHTAEEFGVDVPEGSYEQMAGAIDDEDDWAEVRGEDWFTAAQATAEEQDFFHWELEFPEVFFNAEGKMKTEAGFDAVVGNPPYLLLQGTKQQEIMRSFYPQIFTGTNDILHFFIKRASEVVSDNRSIGYVTSRYWLESEHSDSLRDYVADSMPPAKILDFGNLQIWPEVSILCVVSIFHTSDRTDTEVFIDSEEQYDGTEQFLSDISNGSKEPLKMPTKHLGASPWNLRALSAGELWESMREDTVALKEVSEITQGIKSGNNEAFTVTQETIDEYSLEVADLLPLSRAKDIRPYDIKSDRYVIYADNEFDPGEYPNIISYLESHKSDLENRTEAERGKYPWWRLQRPHERRLIEASEKVLVPHYAKINRFAYTNDGTVGMTDTFLIVPNGEYNIKSLTAILNSSLLNLYMRVFGKQKRAGYLSYAGNRLESIPIPDINQDSFQFDQGLFDYFSEKLVDIHSIESKSVLDSEMVLLSKASEKRTQITNQRTRLNTSVLDYLSTDVEIQLSEVGLYQPTQGTHDTILSKTASERASLRVGSADVARKSPNTVLIEATARYKPDEEDAHETDQWGYTETEYLPAFRITDLTETEADLIEHFVPVAVDEAGGFANFRETATKTNSLIDRLKAIELPDIDDVAGDLENYLRTKERAEELDEKIEKTDELIDEIVYELYGLTDEEIEIVEEAVKE
ncbi:Eco57I restriction-modification methylase domain-containing protein [Halorubrum aethiopicum]|uniref:Eco57I restriction-modification methylase domain-containing protein n=1 Tax=Halorubrum aethiopicum TaxID=1758255 RepID=UPI00082B2326|nr:TaqI-like C-terminal specificity domain-containing protein [Halorubrum aethiopicum]